MSGVASGASGPRIAVVGGGINGAGVAWELVRRGYAVALFDQGAFGAKTSSATTKLIHGGLRYLEHFRVRLVRESLRERAWLLRHLPQLVRPIEIVLPVYRDSPRSRFRIHSGLVLYDLLAGRGTIEPHTSLTAEEVVARVPVVREGLSSGFSYWDAQVDDRELVRTVVRSAVRDGVEAREFTRVESLRRDGKQWMLRTPRGEERYDFVVNAAGPWMNQLLEASGIESPYRLSLVRGSHLVLRRRVSDSGVLLQSADDRRVFFVLPWKETTLVGTTEVVQREPLDRIEASREEIAYLLARYNRYFREAIGEEDIRETFAGVRPLVGRSSNPSAIGREYRVVRDGNAVNVFGGKMTTFMALARRVALRVDNYFGKTRKAKEALFDVEGGEGRAGG
ncbi:MAG TPA: FAD-dependent oxidoreductase [Thermoanaerobaculia bacterium]|nr:FAD-dependent oxidoreductase [Thermoanaerobaculia bacterium]